MNIAQLKGEQTVKALAERLLAEPTKDTRKTNQAEMEAALLRLIRTSSRFASSKGNAHFGSRRFRARIG